MAEKEYRKLPGRGVQLLIPSRLYLGRDHLLKLTYIGGAEEYKRFYFTDIQAVILRRTAAHLWWLIGLGVPAALFGLWGLFLLTQFGRSVDAGLILGSAGFLLMALLIHLLLGPTCKVVLKTAVHTEPLPSLSRVRTARKAIAALAASVEPAQAEIAIAEVEEESPNPVTGQDAPLQTTPEL